MYTDLTLRVSSVVIFLVFFAVAIHARVASAERKPLHQRDLLSYPVDELVKTAFPDLEHHTGEGQIDILPWPYKPETLVVVMLDPSYEGSSIAGIMTIHIALLARQDKKLVRHAYGYDSFEGIRWGNAIKLDLLPYRISASETAFGVRFLSSYASTGYSMSTVDLFLYRLSAEKIFPIFQASVENEYITKPELQLGQQTSESETEEEKSTMAEYASAIVMVDPQKTNGYYDLVVKTKKGEKDVDTNKITVKQVLRTRHRWNGTSYAEDKTP